MAVTLRNLAGEHFTVAERNLSVAALPQEGLALGGVAVGYDVVTAQGAEALELLEPIEVVYPDQAEVVEGLGFAYYLVKDYGEALPRFEHAMALRPPDITVLNATGDCYQRLGRADKAREMFELSLSVNPNQEGVRIRLLELQVQ